MVKRIYSFSGPDPRGEDFYSYQKRYFAIVVFLLDFLLLLAFLVQLVLFFLVLDMNVFIFFPFLGKEMCLSILMILKVALYGSYVKVLTALARCPREPTSLIFVFLEF